MNNRVLRLALIGAGGHARVLVGLARAARYHLLGVCDPTLAAEGVASWEGLDVLGDDSALNRFAPDRVALMLGIGKRPAADLRERLYDSLRELGYHFPALVHPAAWVSQGVLLNQGAQVMAGVVIQPGCEIGENSIVNTRASVDHDCRIGRNVHIAPGVTLCGSVTVEDGAFIGAGATVIQGVHVGRGALVGAGVTLLRDLRPNATIIGAANRHP
jgi:sugar O-acyltransferase (sialic acid O-acetyltransferase NeuD family)